ncbi:MAG: hypothetical protein HQM14_09120, partial [SAR324 cluster bacterium]|nr:hypothetical protein [SAR324 cluster bacterium]
PMHLNHWIKFAAIIFVVSIIIGCSHHFRDGKNLEEKQRLEEASIEYRLAFVESPDKEEISEALQRVNEQVAEENFERYQEYLQKKEFKKAYRRLEAATIQHPNHKKLKSEQKHWIKILIAGKIQFLFDRLQTNIRLADEMQLQININTPAGKILTVDISNETGIFFAEDVVYKLPLNKLPFYSINSIGLKLKRFTPDKRPKQEFKQFINFRGLIPGQSFGSLQINPINPVRTVLSHRPQLIGTSSKTTPWFPPRLIRYNLSLENSKIKAITPNRMEFMPSILYLNNAQQRAFVDFGAYQLTLDKQTRIWGIEKTPYLRKSDDYFYQFSQNLALYPYFFYRDGVYRYTKH